MLKPYDELRKVDISKHCEQRDGMDYLNWAKCIDLLHENGAETAYFEPVVNPETGSSLFMTNKVFGEESKANQCYEIEVKVFIDDKVWNFRGPLMNGSNPVRDNSLSQQRIWNAQCRAFVKCVAIHTGLGFDLWLKEEKENAKKGDDDLHIHNILKIKERVEQKVSSLLAKGASLQDVADATGLQDEDDVRQFMRYYTKLYNFEGFLSKVKINDKK